MMIFLGIDILVFIQFKPVAGEMAVATDLLAFMLQLLRG